LGGYIDITILNERQRLGYFNIHETAKLLNIAYQTLRENIRRGDIPRPSRLIGRRMYYCAADVENLTRTFGARRKYKEYRTFLTNSPGEPALASGIWNMVMTQAGVPDAQPGCGWIPFTSRVAVSSRIQ
jgi:hypothetical protein